MAEPRQNLRRFVKTNKTLQSQLGEITSMREIGEGANGLVYEAVLHGVPIAIKFLVEPTTHKLTRFKAEYLNVVMLPSNKFVAKPLLYEEFEISALKYSAILLKKYVGRLQRPVAPTRLEVHKLFKFLMDSVSFIHSHGIIHRDLKPENILVEGEQYVLADFGIANYNPEMFLLKADTAKGERLGNRRFSAPEQEEGGVSPHPTMDIYAIGQIIQWFVTGSVHRGTQRARISDIIPGCEVHDLLVEKCLSNDPKTRFQSVEEMRVVGNRLTMEASGRAERVRPFVDPYEKYVDPFADALRKVRPRVSHGAFYTDDKRRIDRFITSLAQHDFDTRLWWTDGTRDMYFSFTRIDESTWLMGRPDAGDEVKIGSMWVYLSPSTHGDVVLLNMEEMPSFGLHGNQQPEVEERNESDLPPFDEAALLDETHYITRAEYDNGYAEIGEEVIDLTGHKLSIRTRSLAPYSVFIGTVFHNIRHRESDAAIRAFLKTHNHGEGITEVIFERFGSSLRHNLHENVIKFL